MRQNHGSIVRGFFSVVILSGSGLVVGCGGSGNNPPPDMGPDLTGEGPAVCGDSIVSPGERCDTAITSGTGSCPTSPADCDDGNNCTVDGTEGSGCLAGCTHEAAQCTDADLCCPSGCDPSNDDDCGACGNGTVEPNETCDSAIPGGTTGACLTTCADDGDDCTIEALTGTPLQCNVACEHNAITTCLGGDSCCAPGCNANNDSDCTMACGNSVVEGTEICDGNCPTTCADDGNVCTSDVLAGSSVTCDVVCTHPAITACTDGDGCCAPGCNANSDDDCLATCGNGVVEGAEVCDGNCPTTCTDTNACTNDVLTGTPGQCNVMCTHPAITTCTDGDGCCAGGCNANNDDNCNPMCGNGVVEMGELCDGNCPTTCADDGNTCTSEVLTGSVATCNRQCTHPAITMCTNGDGCCPTACNATNDNNCSASCGNGVVEGSETCDGNCPATCDDMMGCTMNVRTGSSGMCNVQCSYPPITTCTNGDGCCAPGCNQTNDNNCMSMCGNGVVEMGETCDGNCPTTCNDANSCTTDALTGTLCTRACTFTPITMCTGGDGCCPMSCNANNDSNCTPMCGNGVVEMGETCDGSCPTMCNDANSCTTDVLTGTLCTRQCVNTPITTCTNGDGCCAPGCNANNDNNCMPMCGNGVVEGTETCDGSCPSSCMSDGNACTNDATAGSAGMCNVTCPYTPITACVNGDGCCPAGCTPANDNNCMASFCTLIYNLTPNIVITGTPLGGAGDGTFPQTGGRVVIRVQANGSGQPLVGGTAELLNIWVDTNFTVAVVNTNLNSFSATCNGTVNPPPAGETMTPYTTPPATCAYTDSTTTMALGTFTGTQVTWNMCAGGPNYAADNYTTANSLMTTGTGCIRNYRSVGIITCTAFCSLAGLAMGQNLSDSNAHLVPTTFAFSNGVTNLTVPNIELPNNQAGRTRLNFTGVRPMGAAGGTCL